MSIVSVMLARFLLDDFEIDYRIRLAPIEENARFPDVFVFFRRICNLLTRKGFFCKL